MMQYLKALCAVDGVSGSEDKVRAYIEETVRQFSGILETRTDALGNFLVHKKGRCTPKHTLLVGAHMDEVGLIVTEIRQDGRLSVSPVGGVEPDVIIGRAFRLENGIPGTVGTQPVHKLSAKARDEKPSAKDLYLDIGAQNREEALRLVSPGDTAVFAAPFTEMGGGCVTSKAIDDRFGCAVMLRLLEGEIPFDTWFGFFVQEEIGLRGSRTAAYRIDPDFALILEATTAADLDGVTGGDCVCRLGDGPVVSFMDRSTIYDKEMYRLAMELAEKNGIGVQTKTRIAGGNDAGAVHLTRDGVRTLAVSVPCRYLHSASCTAKLCDMEESLELTEILLGEIQKL